MSAEKQVKICGAVRITTGVDEEILVVRICDLSDFHLFNRPYYRSDSFSRITEEAQGALLNKCLAVSDGKNVIIL